MQISAPHILELWRGVSAIVKAANPRLGILCKVEFKRAKRHPIELSVSDSSAAAALFVSPQLRSNWPKRVTHSTRPSWPSEHFPYRPRYASAAPSRFG